MLKSQLEEYDLTSDQNNLIKKDLILIKDENSKAKRELKEIQEYNRDLRN